jgi:hypothetical protein
MPPLRIVCIAATGGAIHRKGRQAMELGKFRIVVTTALGVFFSSMLCPVTYSSDGLVWHSDYSQAMKVADENHSMMLVYFHADDTELEQDAFCTKLASDASLREHVDKHVLVRVPVSQRVLVKGEEIQLIRHPSFAELKGQAGAAVIDMEDPESPFFRHVVSIYPLDLPGALTRKNLAALLSLPKGSLTQRTLILAVRIHPESPESANGTLLTTLAKESENHSLHQAQITNQGHHNWESRFHRISGQLPDGLMAQEVCAESWPGKGLIAAAIDVVHSWRQSSGHWNAVRRPHRYFGYDMKRGRNGIWYATGIFSTR